MVPELLFKFLKVCIFQYNVNSNQSKNDDKWLGIVIFSGELGDISKQDGATTAKKDDFNDEHISSRRLSYS